MITVIIIVEVLSQSVCTQPYISSYVTTTRGRYRPCETCDFTRSNYLIYIKSENMVRESGKLSTKSGRIGTFTVSIDTASAPGNIFSTRKFCKIFFLHDRENTFPFIFKLIKQLLDSKTRLYSNSL